MRAFGILKWNLLAQSAGWSEVYAIVGSDYSFIQSVLSAIYGDRKATLFSDVVGAGSLISDTDVKGDSFPTGIPIGETGMYAGSGLTSTSVATLALRTEYFAGVLKRGSRFVRAIPGNQIGAGGVYAGTAGYPGLLTAYLSLVATQCCSAQRLRGATSPPFYSFTPYTSYSLSAVTESRKIGRPFGLRRGRVLIA